ncbi:HET-domain-containing protein [Acephala macrosclerotiorum]|nr:HET-domain-containing protein [Acephala macrosclerotiorum]
MKTNEAWNLKGYAKVKKACSVTALDGFEYLWVDTCCIDKTSSAELSEALNSMYLWYEEAEECYAYLANNPPGTINRASKRETTRVENRAYCLMGIFGIFMPVLYGEGERAFIRLQEEIMRVSDDHSLFAWISTEEDHDGILASSPSAFANSNNIIQMKPSNSVNSPPTINSRGIHLSLCFEYDDRKDSGLAVLNCTKTGKENMRLAISLRDVFLTTEDFERERGSRLTLLHLRDIKPPHYSPKDLYVKQWRSKRNRKWEDVEKCVIKLEGVGEENVVSYMSPPLRLGVA